MDHQNYVNLVLCLDIDGRMECGKEGIGVERHGTTFTEHQTSHHHRLRLELDQPVTTATGLRKIFDVWDNLHYTYAHIKIEAKIVCSLMICLRVWRLDERGGPSLSVVDPPLEVIEIPAFSNNPMLSSGALLVGELKKQGAIVASYCYWELQPEATAI